ncbi:MAG: TIGR00730 family Rossman fold protein [Anaerolineales bacterium]|nr:TIGR00730 family Rossman fold protein [Anaerolineales bacterium]
MNSICVYCGSADNIHPDYLLAARQMGATLARRGLTLIYGGGRTGLMGALADGALENSGQVIGVIVASMNTPALAHPGLTRMEVTPLIHERKARMYALADAYLALPGGYGTLDELFETLTWAQIGEHAKPIGLLNVRAYFNPLLKMIEHAEKEGFIFPEHRRSLLCASDPGALLDAIHGMENHRHSEEAVKRWMRQK